MSSSNNKKDPASSLPSPPKRINKGQLHCTEHEAPANNMELLLQEIRAITPKLDNIEKQTAAIREDLKMLQVKVNTNTARLDEAEPRISQLEDATQNIPEMQRRINDLESALIDQENRARRNNIRIFGLPESIEKDAPEIFLTQWLPKALSLDFDPPLDIQRAHRIPTRRNNDAKARARPMIAYLLRFTQVKQILNKVKELKKVTYAGQDIYISPDYARETANMRKRFLELRPALRKLNIRFGLIHPAKMVVTYKAKHMEFFDPSDLVSFIKNAESEEMDTTSELPNISKSQEEVPTRQPWAQHIRSFQYQANKTTMPHSRLRPTRLDNKFEEDTGRERYRSESRSPLKQGSKPPP